ncbi:MAG TPA: hypothetical protein VF192_15185 [Longimicrobiales bacterium]
MDFISDLFPFTLDEIRRAFVAQGLSKEEADKAARSLAAAAAASDGEPGFGFAEFGRWLDRIAELSEDAAARVARFRELRGPSNPGFF